MQLSAKRMQSSPEEMQPPSKESQNGGEDNQTALQLETSNSSSSRRLNVREILGKSDNRHALFSGIVTLTLSIMGGAVLPVSNAFSVTGIVCGFLIMFIVASANAFTCDLLLRQAHYTGADDYESLAFSVGGKWWKLITEISIVVLMVGTIIGTIQQVGESAVSGLLRLSKPVPHWLTNGSGRVLTLIFVLTIIAPLCLVNKMRQLEYAATVGTSIVLWLLVVIVVEAIKKNLPALRNGELAAVGFSKLSFVTQAISTFGFAFYIQPMMMPFLTEMPPGQLGVKLTSYSVRVVILGTSFFIYGAVGFFGAARYGKSTEGNILENKWLGGGVAQAVLNLAMAVYLALSVPTVEFPTRHTLNNWIPGKKQQPSLARHLFISAVIITFCTGFSLIFPNKSSTVVTITGATGVCMVSYLVPVVNHLLLFFQRAKCQKNLLGNPDLQPSYRKTRSSPGFWNYLVEVVAPIAVVIIGVFSSIAALTTL